MEINMMHRHSLISRPTAIAVPHSHEACRAEAPAATSAASLLHKLARAGVSFFGWLNPLGARPLDPEALEHTRSRHMATLRIKGIGH
jgi:hypothetical protein